MGVQLSSVAQSCPTLCDPMDYSTPGFAVHQNSWSLLRLKSIDWVMPSNHLILCLPLEFLEEALWGRKGRSTPRMYLLQWGQVSAPSKMEEVQMSHFSHFSRSVVTDSLRLHEPQHARSPFHHQLLKFTQTHVHWVRDAIQTSHPLSSPFPPAFSLCQHQGLFQWVSSSHQVPKVLEFQLQHQSFQWTFRAEFPSDGVVGYPCSPRDSQESSPTLHFKSINSLVCSFLYSPTLTYIHDHWKNHSFN